MADNNDYINSNFNLGNDQNDLNNNDGGKKTWLVILATAFFLIVIIMILLIVTVPNALHKNDAVNEYNEIVANIITQEVSNEPIIDNTEETLDRRYGKVDVVFLDRNDNIIDIPLAPSVGDMIPVKYDEKERKYVKVDRLDPSWYDYSSRKWANAVNKDGSYFVWIPRFAYKITYYSTANYSNAIGYCDSRGLLKISGSENGQIILTRIQSNSSSVKEIGNHYMLAPAFMRDALNNYENGGWDVSINGFWVAKYEMSMEQNSQNVHITDSNTGNVKVSNTIKSVSKPGLNSWRYISVGNAYYNGLNYDKDKQSHLIKNSEWAAVSYLASSQYGTNGEAIQKNDDVEFVTGGATNLVQIYLNNGKQSTTWNSTGVYDLSGGAREFVASFIDNGFKSIAEYGGTDTDMIYETKESSKYKTIYPHVPQDIGEAGTYDSSLANANYNLLANRRGDAMYEVSNYGFGTSGWFTSNSYMAQSDVPFMLRGLSARDTIGTGTYAFNNTIGQPNNTDGYRVCLVIQ